MCQAGGFGGAAIQGRGVRRPVPDAARDTAQCAHEQELLDAALRAKTEKFRVERELRLAEQRQAAILQTLRIVLYLEDGAASPRRLRFVAGNLVGLTGFDFEAVAAVPICGRNGSIPRITTRSCRACRPAEGAGGGVRISLAMCADGTLEAFPRPGRPLRDDMGWTGSSPARSST